MEVLRAERGARDAELDSPRQPRPEASSAPPSTKAPASLRSPGSLEADAARADK